MIEVKIVKLGEDNHEQYKTEGGIYLCPYLPCKRREDWGIDDPTGKSDDEFLFIIRTVEGKITELAKSLR